MKYIESRMGKIILMVCWIAYLFFCIQPVHIMAATNNNYTVEDDIWADTPSIIGESGIVMEVSTGTILFEKNIHDTHYPASITKILTALIVIENCGLDETVTFSNTAVNSLEPNSSIRGGPRRRYVKCPGLSLCPAFTVRE